MIVGARARLFVPTVAFGSAALKTFVDEFNCRTCCLCQANVAQSKHSVFPVPVGDSSKAFSERSKASSTTPM